MPKKAQIISVAARNSPLSKAQVNEILLEIHKHHPHLSFNPAFVVTHGDKDQMTSLRTLGKTDFFTREVDHLLLNGTCQIAVHSAKDLPEPLPQGLQMVALTIGLDPADVLVLRSHESIESLPEKAVVATSSERREEAVRQLLPKARFIDVRGTISQRLSLLETQTADAVVIAEAALIRLKLTHLNRIRLLGPTAALQGQLAVISRYGDAEMQSLFACIDSRT